MIDLNKCRICIDWEWVVSIRLEYYEYVYISMKSVHHLTSVFNIPEIEDE